MILKIEKHCIILDKMFFTINILIWYFKNAFVSKYNIQNIVNVYNGTKDQNGRTYFKDVTQNLDEIFKHLSEPMAKLQMIS